MKDFLSEYGFAILAAIVVILLIAMCTPVGNLIKNQIMGVVDKFATKTESKLYSMDASQEFGVIVKQLDENGKFSIKATTDSETDKLVASYKVKDQHGNWSDWKELGTLSTGSKEHSAEFTAKIENGNRIQVRVTDEGKNDDLFYESNVVEYTGASSEGGEFTGTSSETPSTNTEEDITIPEGLIELDGISITTTAMGNEEWEKYFNSWTEADFESGSYSIEYGTGLDFLELDSIDCNYGCLDVGFNLINSNPAEGTYTYTIKKDGVAIAMGKVRVFTGTNFSSPIAEHNADTNPNKWHLGIEVSDSFTYEYNVTITGLKGNLKIWTVREDDDEMVEQINPATYGITITPSGNNVNIKINNFSWKNDNDAYVRIIFSDDTYGYPYDSEGYYEYYTMPQQANIELVNVSGWY